jgi:hypothetical protein
MDTEGTVTYELRADVAWLGLNRPHKRNAISEALLAEFEGAVRRAHDEARVLVVFGHGACFSAGLDLAEHRGREPGSTWCRRVRRSLRPRNWRQRCRRWAAHRSRGAACASARPGHERSGRPLCRELDGGTLSVRCRGRRAACGFRGKAGCQGGVALPVIDRCLARRGSAHLSVS